RSELCQLNRDPRPDVTASPLLVELSAAVRWAGDESGGLVDATCLPALEAAGYRHSLVARGEVDREVFLAAAPRMARPALPDAGAAWRSIEVDRERRLISRPRGVRIDSGGLAKGIAADLLASTLKQHA